MKQDFQVSGTGRSWRVLPRTAASLSAAVTCQPRERLNATANCYKVKILPAGNEEWLLSEGERLAQLFASAPEQLVRLRGADHD